MQRKQEKAVPGRDRESRVLKRYRQQDMDEIEKAGYGRVRESRAWNK
jgi:hypothetical protein